MKKILIIGPFKDIGGRELMTSFIAGTLSKKYTVDVISTDDMSKSSEVYKNYNEGDVTSLKELLYKRNLAFRFFSFMAYIKNRKKHDIYSYVNNGINKRFDYKKKNISILKRAILKYDLLFINAQLTSNYMEEVVNFASENNRHVVF